MRMSVRESDPGYNVNAMGYSAYLDGVKIEQCFTADEELGKLWAFAVEKDGKFSIDINGNPKEIEMCGLVEIRKDMP